MANLKNSLVATVFYLSVVAAVYGFTATIPIQPGKHTSVHWGAGAIGRQTTDVMSTTSSLSGGSARHDTFDAYHEGKTGGARIGGSVRTGGSVGAYTQATGSGH